MKIERNVKHLRGKIMKLERLFPKNRRWKWDEYVRVLDEGADFIPCVEKDGTFSGILWYKDNELLSLSVLPKFRKKRIAWSLMEVFIAKLRQGVRDVAFLDVSPEAIPALRLYTKFGFVPASYNPNYYGKSDGALRLVRIL